jgi:membrane fusion protein (multidrug efflux system)
MVRLPINSIRWLGRSFSGPGPYAVLALLLPGGILIAGLVWMVRHRSWLASHARALGAWVLIAAVGVLISACSGHGKSLPAARPAVTVVTLRSGAVSLTTQLPGRVSAYRIADVRPQVGGIILKRLFTEGERVEAGRQLYQIDPAPYQAALASARASLAHARAATVAARLTAERYQSLVEARAVSRQDYDNALATQQQDEADVASAESAVRNAEINLAYTKVYSPISGHTGRSAVTEGALVTSNQATSLVTVTQLDPVYVDLTQPSTIILRFKRELASGLIRSIGADKAPTQLVLEDGDPYAVPGTLEFSEVSVDEGTGSVTLRAIFPNPSDLLLPGMFVHATIKEGVREGAILAPEQGITHAPDGTATALVVGPQDKVESRTVVLDRTVGNDWVVTHGLNAGDRLIVGGMQSVKAGMQVAVRLARSAPTPIVSPIGTAPEPDLAAR